MLDAFFLSIIIHIVFTYGGFVGVLDMRCSLYSRVSTDYQTIENQLSILREVARNRGFTIVSEYSDEGISGAKGREARKGFDELMKASVRGEHDIILVWSVDRLGRDLSQLVSFMNETQSVGVDLYIHQQGLDTSTAAGKLMYNMTACFAEFERSLISERIKAGQQRAKAQGKRIGRKSNLNDGLKESIKYMRSQGVSIGRIAKDLRVGVGTIYKVLEAA